MEYELATAIDTALHYVEQHINTTPVSTAISLKWWCVYFEKLFFLFFGKTIKHFFPFPFVTMQIFGLSNYRLLLNYCTQFNSYLIALNKIYCQTALVSVQITENSGKARPVMMAIMDSKDPSSKSNHENPIVKFPKWTSPRISDEEKEYDNTWALTDPEYYVDFFHRRGSWAPLMGLTSDQIYIVLK